LQVELEKSKDSPQLPKPEVHVSNSPIPVRNPQVQFPSSSPIFTLHKAPLPSVSASSEEFGFYQDIYLLSQERNLNLLSNRFNKSFNPPENNISFIDKSPVDHPTIDDTAKTLPRLSKNGRFLRNMFASPEDSRLTGSSFSQNSKNSFSSPEFLRNHFKFRNASLTSYNTSTESESFHRKPSKEERYLFAKGIKRSAGFHDAELLEKRLHIDEEKEDDDSTSISLSLDKSELSDPMDTPTSSEEKETISRPLRKSTAFHDQDILEQQVRDNETREVELRKKVVEAYVEHIYDIKLRHQAELEKVEEIYKQHILDLGTTSCQDVDTLVKQIRAEAELALLKTRDPLMKNENNQTLKEKETKSLLYQEGNDAREY